jgi:GH25 family lysozyme M1 (1,4-beta-N-acetylmuramidase)
MNSRAQWCATRTGFHADQARRQRGDQLNQLVARDWRPHQRSATGLVDTVDGKNVLGEIDANGNNSHCLSLSE